MNLSSGRVPHIEATGSPGPELSASLSIGKLFLEIDIGELLSISVAHDEASAVEFFKRPRGEATRGGGHRLAIYRERDRSR